MAEEPRVYAGLDVSWPDATGSDDETAGFVLAEADGFGPVGAEPSKTGLRIFFGSADDRTAAAAHLRQTLPACGVEAIDVPDDRWAERSQASLTAVVVGGLTVAPPWDLPADRTGLIIIQPSMGFGTGHHASTRLCLRLVQDAPVAGAGVLDVGTGSGVLAIAAWRLGAASVVAIDSDQDAITSARECVALNGATPHVELRHQDLTRDPTVAGGPFSLVLANLTGGLLAHLADPLNRLITPGGTLIVSGVTSEEEDAVTGAFFDRGARLDARLSEDEWVGLRFTC